MPSPSKPPSLPANAAPAPAAAAWPARASPAPPTRAAATYAEKFIQIWDKLSWSFTCKDAKGKTVDPRSLFPNSRYAGPEQGKTKALRLDGKN